MLRIFLVVFFILDQLFSSDQIMSISEARVDANSDFITDKIGKIDKI